MKLHGFRWSVLAGALLATGCFPPDDGRDPPLDRIYFPVGLALDRDATRLYVANSDFDLQFNAGSLQAYDVERLLAFAPTYCDSDAECAPDQTCDRTGSHWCVDRDDPEPCGALGDKTPAQRLLSPGRCNSIDPESPPSGRSVRVASVEIGAFVTDVLYRPSPTDAEESEPWGRLFLPVRGDATLHWVDVVPGTERELDCGQGSDRACDGNHRRGDDPSFENRRGVSLPPEPFGVASDDRADTVVTTHQVDGQVALFLNDWENGDAGGPRLVDVLGGLPTGAVGVESIPLPRRVTKRKELAERFEGSATGEPVPYQPGYLVVFRDAPQASLLRVFDQEIAFPGPPFLVSAESVTINTVSLAFQSRGIAVDATARRECETTCESSESDAGAAYNACVDACRNDSSDAQIACEAGCDAAPVLECLDACFGQETLGVYVSNRLPNTLIVGETRPGSNDRPRFDDAIPVPAGPSRVVVGNVMGADGVPVPRIFVVCFDSRAIYVYDPVRGMKDTVIYTGRGPHAFAVDSKHHVGYIAHFTDSYIGVVDLDQRHADHYGQIVLTVGSPTPPRASK